MIRQAGLSTYIACFSEAHEVQLKMVLVWSVRKCALHQTPLLRKCALHHTPLLRKCALHHTPLLTLARRLVTNSDSSLSVLEVRGCGEQNTR